MRIIGGLHRSRQLRFPPTLQLRPTPDRVRETVFNWLGQDLTGKRCLDLFAGSGAFGFECASRGAAQVVMVERDAKAVAALQANADLLAVNGVQVVRGDALEFLQAGGPAPESRFDVVFLDPPYAYDQLGRVLAALSGWISPTALIYREGPSFLEDSGQWASHRRAKAGAVHYQLMKAIHD